MIWLTIDRIIGNTVFIMNESNQFYEIDLLSLKEQYFNEDVNFDVSSKLKLAKALGITLEELEAEKDEYNAITLAKAVAEIDDIDFIDTINENNVRVNTLKRANEAEKIVKDIGIKVNDNNENDDFELGGF